MTGSDAGGLTADLHPVLDPDRDEVRFLGRPVPIWIERTHHVLGDGTPLWCDEAWQDVFAVVEHGEIDLQTAAGTRMRLGEGDSVVFALTGPVSLRAAGRRAVLAAVRRAASLPATRRPPDEHHTDPHARTDTHLESQP